MSGNPNDHDDELVGFLDWHVEAGVDVFLTDEPTDRFAETPAIADATVGVGRRTPVSSQSPGSAEAAPPPTVIDDDRAVLSAGELAASAETLSQLQAILHEFDGCGLKKTAKSLVFADGKPDARVMMIGEAPGRDEDIQGKPFVGRSGQLLNRMLHAIGLERDHIYIANIVPWRPPGNRTPTPVETEICLPFLTRQIELAAPEIIVPLGGAAAKRLLNTDTGIMKARGKWHNIDIGSHHAAAIATLHPAYLLRSPIQKRIAWRDLMQIKRRLSGD